MRENWLPVRNLAHEHSTERSALRGGHVSTGQGSDSGGERVVVLGANGVMGAGAAETFRGRRLSRGDAGAGAGQG